MTDATGTIIALKELTGNDVIRLSATQEFIGRYFNTFEAGWWMVFGIVIALVLYQIYKAFISET